MTKIVELKYTRADVRRFVRFAWKLYSGNPNWVPPLISDEIKKLRGVKNPLFENGPHVMFMAYEGEKPTGRILAGMDEKLNSIYNKRQGYFALFECIDDQATANALFDAAASWCKQRGANAVIGPVSPTNGDDSKGLLINDFDSPPVLMNSFNPEYYVRLYESYGFVKDEDHIAYIIRCEELTYGEKNESIQAIMKRFDFRVDRVDLKKIDSECADIHRVLLEGLPEGWEYTTPPSLQAVKDEFHTLKGLYDDRFVFIARSNKDSRPLGFIVALPNFNTVLKRMNGRIFPTGWFHFVRERKRINSARVFVQFVVKDYWRKGVNNAMFYYLYKDVIASGMEFVEASTIGEYNTISRSSVERIGMRHYRTYRVFRKDLPA